MQQLLEAETLVGYRDSLRSELSEDAYCFDNETS